MKSKAQPSTSTFEEIDLISPKELSQRWRCSRSSVDRIARRGAFTRFVLGEGRRRLELTEFFLRQLV